MRGTVVSNRFGFIGILVLVCLLALPGIGSAQDNTSDAAIITRYAGVPYARTDDGGFVLGAPDAPLTIVEFSDFMCPHCQNYEDVIAPLVTNYVLTGQARYEYRMYPIVHPTLSVLTAQVAECADTLQPGLFWPARDVLYDLTRSGQITEDLVAVVATRLGLNGDVLAGCMEDATQYQTDSELAMEMGISGTPAVMVRQGDGDLQWLVIEGQTLNRGGAPYAVLEAFLSGDEAVSTTPPAHLLNERMLPDTSLVDGVPCEAPCWRGIQVGETTWDEALAIVEEASDLTNVQVQSVEDSASVAASWQPVDGEPCCQMYSDTGETVDILFLLTAPVMTLEAVIEQHGEPAYLIASPATSKQASGTLIYPDDSMVVYIFLPGLENGEISESSEVIGVLYLTSDAMRELVANNDLYAWQGYQPYNVYAAGEFANKE